LGLDAQRQAVASFIGSSQLVAEYTEVESGRGHANRPQLLAALEECRKRRAVLLIARLDRLARNVAFIANLMESGADFVAVDMPQATRLTIHILAAVAEHEREMISKRTKVALAEAKRSGTKLGNPRIEDARPLAVAAHHAHRPTPEGGEAHDRLEGARQDAPRDCHRLKPPQYTATARPRVVREQRQEPACMNAVILYRVHDSRGIQTVLPHGRAAGFIWAMVPHARVGTYRTPA
jgi:hypothetical protein